MNADEIAKLDNLRAELRKLKIRGSIEICTSYDIAHSGINAGTENPTVKFHGYYADRRTRGIFLTLGYGLTLLEALQHATDSLAAFKHAYNISARD